MNVSTNKRARRLAVLLAGLLAALLLALPVAAAPQVDKTSPVNDYAGILTDSTIQYVTEVSAALQSTCGAEIGVYTTEYIGNSTMEGYAYSVLNEWGLGSADKDNGVLLLLAPGEDDYYITRGTGLESALSISTLSTILDDKLEPNWVNGDYDTGVHDTVAAIADKLCSIVYGAREVRGSDSSDRKDVRLTAFTEGLIRRLVTKPSIAGFGLNWQKCHNMIFVGLSDSYEMLYQAIRRCWRFGQKQPVNVYIVISQAEGAVKENIIRKDEQCKAMIAEMVKHTKDILAADIKATVRMTDLYEPTVDMTTPPWLIEGGYAA